MLRMIRFGLVAATMTCGMMFALEQAVVADDAANAEELKAIRASASAFVKAYGERDAKAIAALFAADADSIDEDGTPIRGRAAIEVDYTELFADGAERIIQIDVKSVRLVTPDVAIEDGSFCVSPEPPGPPCDRKYTAVHVKRDGHWLISNIRDTRIARPSHYEQLKDLEWMIGDWIDESHDSLVETSCQWSDNKNYILRKYKVKIAGVNSHEGVQRIAWDPSNNRIRSWMFDSQGGFGEAVWTKDGNRWIIEGAGYHADGTKASATNILSKIDNDKFTWISQDRVVGGAPIPNVEEITIVRKPPAAK